MRRPPAAIAAIALAAVLGASGPAGAAGAETAEGEAGNTRAPLALADGGATWAVTLRNGRHAVTIVPALGGKIISFKTGGREWLSRSGRPYRARTPDMAFGDTEFDGIDEIFPTLAEAEFTGGPWAGTRVPAHGELFRQAWDVVPPDGGGDEENAVTLEARGTVFPYRFRRRASLTDRGLELHYALTNTGDRAFPVYYAFHPLLAAEDGMGLALFGGGGPDRGPDMRVTVAHRGFPAAPGPVADPGALADSAGRRFVARQFDAERRGYYKYVLGHPPYRRPVDYRAAGAITYPVYYPSLAEGAPLPPKLKDDAAVLRLEVNAQVIFPLPPDRDRRTGTTDDLPLSRLAVWVDEGGATGLRHFGVEPATGLIENVAEAAREGEAPVLEPGRTFVWRIALHPPPL